MAEDARIEALTDRLMRRRNGWYDRGTMTWAFARLGVAVSLAWRELLRALPLQERVPWRSVVPEAARRLYRWGVWMGVAYIALIVALLLIRGW